MNTNTAATAAQAEARALLHSIFGYAFMAALGIGFALLTRSEAILLDGVYSLMSFFMALVAKRVAVLAEQPGSDTFHFGYAHFEPLLNVLRGLSILMICSLALVSALDALFNDGRPLNAGLAVIYGVGASAGCLLLSQLQKRAAKRLNSPTLTVDARNWLVDGLVSLGAATAFVIAYLLQHTQWQHLVPYVDPLLVTVLCAVLLWVPVMTIWENLREVLMVAPEPPVQSRIRERIEESVADIDTRELHVRMWKVGRIFYVMVHLVVPDSHVFTRIADLDQVRVRLRQSLADFHPRLAVDAIVTADANYAAGLDG